MLPFKRALGSFNLFLLPDLLFTLKHFRLQQNLIHFTFILICEFSSGAETVIVPTVYLPASDLKKSLEFEKYKPYCLRPLPRTIDLFTVLHAIIKCIFYTVQFLFVWNLKNTCFCEIEHAYMFSLPVSRLNTPSNLNPVFFDPAGI